MKLSHLITGTATISSLVFSLGAPEGLGQVGIKAVSSAAKSVTKVFSPKVSSNLDALREAIIGNESGGNHKAVNRHSRALGLGQVTPKNVGPWSREALGYTLTESQFLNSRELQLKILNYKLAQYDTKCRGFYPSSRQTQVQCVASTWYSGNPHAFTSTRTQYYGSGTYPSINHYSLMAYENYLKLGGK